MERKIIALSLPKKTIRAALFTALLLLFIALFLWLQGTVDAAIVLFHNAFHQHAAVIDIFQLISRYGMGFISLAIGGYAFMVNKNEKFSASKPYLLFILFTFAFASIFGDLLKEIIRRPRPVIALANQIANTAPANSPAFPSGHATKSMALALPFALVIPGKDVESRIVKFITLTTAFLVSYSRIVLQRHYLSDVLAGIVIAFLFIPIGNQIVNLFYRKMGMDQTRLNTLVKRLRFIFCLLAIPLCVL